MDKNKKLLLFSVIFMVVYLIFDIVTIVLSYNELIKNITDVISNGLIILLSIVGIIYYLILYFKKDVNLKKHRIYILIFGIIFFILNLISGILSFILYSNLKEKKEKRELPKLEPATLVNKYAALILFIFSMLLLFVIPNYINLKYGFIIYIVLLIGTIIVFGRQMLHDFKIFKEYFREYNILILKTWGKALVTIIIINLIIQIFTNESSATNQKNLQEMFNILPIAVAALSIIYAPIVEESLFRGVIRKFINNKYLYIIFSGVLFGALHVIDDFQTVQELLYIFVYSALGMYLASLYYKTNNICTNMYMHFLQNTLSVVGMLLLKFMI